MSAPLHVPTVTAEIENQGDQRTLQENKGVNTTQHGTGEGRKGSQPRSKGRCAHMKSATKPRDLEKVSAKRPRACARGSLKKIQQAVSVLAHATTPARARSASFPNT